MENKTTTELLDLVTKLVGKDGHLEKGWEEAWEELQTRHPFYDILSEDMDESIPALWEKIEDLEGEIKKLKRHSHKGGRVVISI